MENSRDYFLPILRRFGLRTALAYRRALHTAPQAVAAWEQQVQQLSAPQHEGMRVRPLRPYLRQHFNVAERVAVLTAHLQTMAQYFASNPQLCLDEPGLEVAQLEGKNGARYFVHVGGNTSKEGELCFSINDAQGNYMAKLVGTVAPDRAGARVLWVGGLQGAKPPHGRDKVVRATRDCYGLRPKNVVVIAAQVFARVLDLRELRAPDNEGHISQRGWRKLRRKRAIYADYGQFWEEIGGVAESESEYKIPLHLPQRALEEVKRHKRSEWKKRQQLTAALEASVVASLTALQGAQPSSL